MTKKEKIIKTAILLVTLAAIIVTGIIFEQKFIRMLPLIFSVFIMLSQSEANRYGYLAGGLNSLLYVAVYISLGLYASAASAALFSFPIQILTFLRWRKRSFESSTVFKKMSNKMRIVLGSAFLGAWIVVFVILRALGSDYAFLDNTSSLLGIVVSILTMLAYIEYSYLWALSSVLSLLLNIQVAIADTGHITYVVYSIYCLYCTVASVINVQRLYKKQQADAGKGK